MSDNIPFEMQADIMKRLPVKSLIQFRSVSKTWKSHIDSSDFIVHYSSKQQHLLVTYDDPNDSKRRYVSIADDDAFPQHKVSPTIPHLVNMLKYSDIIGSSHGLFCLYIDEPKPIAVFWNLLIGKAVAVAVPNIAPFGMYHTFLGFGVCPETVDPKIVKITHIDDTFKDIDSVSCIPWQVEVFTLSTGAWRSPYGNLPRKSIHFDFNSVFIDGILYWLAMNRITTYRGPSYYNLVVSFDVTTEEFGEIDFPGSLVNLSDNTLSISKLRNCLVVLECYAGDAGFGVWMMLDGVPKSFIRLFRINSSDACVRGFRNSGEPIIEIVEYHCGQPYGSSLVVYNHYAQDVINLEIDVLAYPFCVYPYIETLLLLDQPDFIIYDKGQATLLSREVGTQGF